MKIFITGGTGFIGNYVVDQLKDNHELLVLARKPQESSTFLQGDMANMGEWISSVEDFGPDAAVHLAWGGVASKEYYLSYSMDGLSNGIELFRALAEMGCKKIIGAGSRWEYGEREGALGEADLPEPTHHLGAAKAALYYMGRGIAKEYNIQLIWTRLFSVYGLGQSEKYLISHLVKSHIAGDAPNIKNPMGGGDFVYVEDAARAIKELIEAELVDFAPIYNIGSGKFHSVEQIEKMISALVQGKNCELSDKKKGFCADITKARADIGWLPRISLKQGIEKMIDYYGK